ncbi:DUF973 family protein [Sulfuracidifex metallicus]|uniref:DUF973 family protein n=1 Tax=Sulfuracidifex metallicus DSM 6482 = JCM 9184 TaxID=523847 RepID=A0A6A9QRG0_SULME|nr:DUF973 family protein [Sulfuracidifex metallicus]MUN29771.1 DUF973 family protein [Sulfuracidifex metallicus DSM 6482 = JCM 9184]WOE51848.1 DUF973 family protein [Sulfuracidifex metallicus DSM 6482 = JCM 9184]
MSYNYSNNPNPSLEADAVGKLRTGILYFIIVPLISVIASLTFFSPIVAIFLLIVSLVVAILGFMKAKGGMSDLSNFINSVGIGSTGLTLVLIGLILELLGAILLLVLVGIAFISIGALAELIGFILFGIGIYRIGSTFNNGLTKIGGILIATLILGFIGLIMSYIGLGEVERNLRSSVGQFPASQGMMPLSSLQVYQIGIGTLNGNGIATFVLYSSQQALISSAQIMGTQYLTSSISPNSLSVGNNNVSANFGMISGLNSGSTYTMRITLSTGQTVDVNLIYRP